MRKERILLYAAVFVIAIHVLVMTKTDRIFSTGRRYLRAGERLKKKAFMGNTKAKVKPMNKDMKKIIWYDVYNKGHGLRNKASNVKFKSCEYKDCVILPPHLVKNNSNGATETVPMNADAVVFQGAHLVRLHMPRRKNPDQVFVFAERESWMFYGVDVKFETYKYANVFNWTMTYRKDSDIYLPYGEIRSLPNQKSKKDGKKYKKIFDGKKREVVWLVSNCASKSLREDYIAELQKYIPIDIIGDCGNQTCPKGNSRNCLTDIEADYKFILSFENTFHKDYVTEKLYDWFNKDIIQVVYGLAKYSTIAPGGTVIDSARFESPEALAQFLKFLGTDRQRYINYLKRKNNFAAVGHEEMQQRAYCKLCKMLHALDKHRRVYEHVGTWWQLNSTEGINPFVTEGVVKIGEVIKKAHSSTDKFVQTLKAKHLL